MNKKSKPQFLKMNYNFYDANINFIGILIWPAILSIGYIILLSLISAFSKVPYGELTETSVVTFITQIFTHLVFLSVFLFYNKKHNIHIFSATKFAKKLEPFRVIVVLIMAFVTIYFFSPFISLLDYLYSLIGFSPSSSLPISLNNVTDLLIAIFSIVLLPAVIEELIFRGVVLNGLKSKLSTKQAIIWSALMFMLMHGSLQQTAYQFILGVILAYVAVTTGNLIYAILLHFMNNLIVVINAYVAVSNNIEVTPATFNSIVEIILPIVWFGVGLILIIWLSKMLKFNSLVNALNKKAINKANNNMDANIIVMQEKTEGKAEGTATVLFEVNNKPKNIKSLEKNDKKIFYLSLLIGFILWLANTITIILS